MKDISELLKQYIEGGSKSGTVQSISTLFALSAESVYPTTDTEQQYKLGTGYRGRKGLADATKQQCHNA